MNRKLAFTAFALALGFWNHAACGQTFSSGSTGVDGAFSPAANQNVTVRPGGVYNYTTVTIPANVTVSYFRNTDNAPVVILATGDVTIEGTINVGGQIGFHNPSTPQLGAPGGPGGFAGGMSGYPGGLVPTSGHGPGGGASAGVVGMGGVYGAPSAFVGLIPLFGGSGGGGGTGFGGGNASPNSGASGGGGGGAILIASNTRIQVNGRILANGGASVGSPNGPVCANQGGPGSGGAIRLVAPTIGGFGPNSVIQAIAGAPAGCASNAGSPGRIRMEANSMGGFVGLTDPVPSIATAPGPVSPAGSPVLSSVPTLAIASVGGVNAPTNQFASYSVPDVTLPLSTVNPVPVVVNLTFTPVGAPTEVRVRLLPRAGGVTVSAPAASHTGTFENSTATANVTLPVGSVTVLQANASMTLTGQFASLFPVIAGEPVHQVVVAANMGEASTVSLVTRSGREVRLDELAPEDRIRASLALAMLRQ